MEDFWRDVPVNLMQTEKRKLSAHHRDQVTAGTHSGRVNFITGLSEPYSIMDLLSSPDELHDEKVDNLPPRYAKDLQQMYGYIRSKSSLEEEMKINDYINRFLMIASSMTPACCQRDISESNFNMLTFGINVQKPASFYLPSSCLASSTQSSKRISGLKPIKISLRPMKINMKPIKLRLKYSLLFVLAGE